MAIAEKLFEPFELGPYRLPHRMVMAPLTRSRARQPGNIPSAMNACYQAQRASAAFIVSEASQVSMQGPGLCVDVRHPQSVADGGMEAGD